MNLKVAKICLDCDEIYTGEQCPVCTSSAYWWLCKFLKQLTERCYVRKLNKDTQAILRTKTGRYI